MSHKSLFIGRFQPLHKGHIALIRTVLDEGKPIVIGLMDTPIDGNNPYALNERVDMFRRAFPDEFDDRLMISVLPPVAEVCYGRNVGYWVRQIHLPADIERITATNIRNDTEPQVKAKAEFDDAGFLDGFKRMSQKVHALSASQGFWNDGAQRNFGEMVALCHSELSEALECMRMGNPADKNITDMSGAEVQLSDVLGILLDMQAGYGLKIAEALERKMEFNRTRGHMHGGKRF